MEHKQILAKPIEFVVACDGAIRKVVVSKNEPEWSINFKKALLVLFQTKVDTYNIQLEQNRVSLILCLITDYTLIFSLCFYVISFSTNIFFWLYYRSSIPLVNG